MGQPVNLDWRTGAEGRMPPNPASSLRYSSECHYIGKTTVNKAVSATDANRRFSELLRTVKQGRSVVVTSHGKPVATISPVVKDNRAAEGARAALLARLRRERVVNAGRWTRDELYDDAP
jgi:prevent-host-death family protein